MKKRLFLALLMLAVLVGAPHRMGEDASAAVTPDALKRGDLNIVGNGDNTVIAAVANKQISVYKIWFVTSGAVNVIYKDGAATSFNASAITFTASGSSNFMPFDGAAYFTTTCGNAFIMNLSSGVQVSGQVYYTLLSC